MQSDELLVLRHEGPRHDDDSSDNESIMSAHGLDNTQQFSRIGCGFCLWLRHEGPRHDDISSDNESIMSTDGPDNTQQFSRLGCGFCLWLFLDYSVYVFETELKDEMGSIARQVKETILLMNEETQQKSSSLDSQM